MAREIRHQQGDVAALDIMRIARRRTAKALDDHNVRKRLVDIGGDIPGKAKRGQQALAALVKSEIARWTPIIKANVKDD